MIDYYYYWIKWYWHVKTNRRNQIKCRKIKITIDVLIVVVVGSGDFPCPAGPPHTFGSVIAVVVNLLRDAWKQGGNFVPSVFL